MTRSNGTPRKKQQQIRMDEKLKARIRVHQEKLRKQTGVAISFSAAVRSLIEKGLDT